MLCFFSLLFLLQKLFAVLHLIQVVGLLIMSHAHGVNAKSATRPAYTNHIRSVK